jgi:hypothetical protein
VKPATQRDGRKNVPWIWPSNHGDPHAPTLPQPPRTAMSACVKSRGRR